MVHCCPEHIFNDTSAAKKKKLTFASWCNALLTNAKYISFLNFSSSFTLEFVAIGRGVNGDGDGEPFRLEDSDEGRFGKLSSADLGESIWRELIFNGPDFGGL
jgi:hypothetical protein